MDNLGTDFNNTGSVMSKAELEQMRSKRGECVTCGRKCFKKKLFKMIPIDEDGLVLNGRCLNCKPLSKTELAQGGVVIVAVTRPATREDVERFARSQSNLGSSNRTLGSPPAPSSARSPQVASSRRLVAPPRARSAVPSQGMAGRIDISNRSMGSAMTGRTDASNRSLGNSQSMMVRTDTSNRSIGSTSSTSMAGTNRRAVSMTPHTSSPAPATPPRIASLSAAASQSQALPLPPLPTGTSNQSLDVCRSPQPTSSRSINSSGLSSQSPLPRSPHLNHTNCSLSPHPNQTNRSLSPHPNQSNRSLSPHPNQSNRSLSPHPNQSNRSLSSHGDLSSRSGGEKVSPDTALSHMQTRSTTQEELEQAAGIILAAPQIYGEANGMRGINHHDTAQRSHSGRSIRSGSSMGDTDEVDDDYDVLPQHGELNRGGSFPLGVHQNGNTYHHFGKHIIGESSKTLSSMSSIEEDIPHYGSSRMGCRGDYRYENTNGSIDENLSANGKNERRNRADSNDCGSSLASQGSTRASSRGRSTTVSSQLSSSEQQQIISQAENQRIGIVLKALREVMESPTVVQESFKELANLQLSPDDLDMLADMGAPNIITVAMGMHAGSPQLQAWACGAIWNMSGTDRNQVAFVQSGAVDRIVAAMDRFIDHVDLQEKALATFSNLGATKDNLQMLFEKGAIRRIVGTMNKHAELANIQIKGCSAVANIASHDSRVKRKMVESGAGGAVVVAMVMHSHDPYVQEKALKALKNLAANSEDNKVELANIGGIDAAISALQTHRDEATVQEEGAWALSVLAGNNENKAVIGDCGGIDVVIRAMWVHSENVGVLEWCCRALYTLTLDPQNCDIVLEVGGISAVVNSMQAHVDSVTVQEMGCAILGNLAATDQNKMRIVDEEALDAIVLAMVLHADDLQVQERACTVLMRLAIGPNVKSMQAANIPELAKVAAGKFPDRCKEPANHLIVALNQGY